MDRPPAASRRERVTSPVGLIVLMLALAVATPAAAAGTNPDVVVPDVGTTGTDEPAPDPEPVPEPAPPTDPGDGATDPDDETADDTASVPWLSIGLVLLALVIAFVLARALLRPRAGSESSAARSASIDDAFRALGDAQWVHDQASLDVLSGPADTAATRWAAQRPVVDQVVRDALRRGVADPRSGWNELSAAVAAVQRALDTATAARSDPSTDPTVVAESIAVVNRAREHLLARITDVRRWV